MNFKNSKKYSPAATSYIERGFYTDAHPGTREYFDYWDEEKNRCLYGYLDITGYHYFYLNFCPIDRVVDEMLPDGTVQARRDRTFPAFYDGDFKYFNAINQARKENKHMTVLKARRKGFSYKAAAMLARNYFHVKNSKNYV